MSLFKHKRFYLNFIFQRFLLNNFFRDDKPELFTYFFLSLVFFFNIFLILFGPLSHGGVWEDPR